VAELTAAVNCLINHERRKFGLPPLSISPKLTQSAQGWSDYLAGTDQFTHGNATGRISAAGYDWGEAGEDLAGGYGTPRDVVAGWMGSQEHCQNILWPDYRDMGAGVNTNPGGPIWNEDFGLLITATPPGSGFTAEKGCPYGMAWSPYTVPPAPECAAPWPCYPGETAGGPGGAGARGRLEARRAGPGGLSNSLELR
jgi:hypothetical protein